MVINMRNEIWSNIDGIGELRIEEYLVYGNEPILFSCRNGNSYLRYLVMMYDSDIFEYVIAPITPHDLAGMLENRLTMEEAFRNNGVIYFTHLKNDMICAKKYDSKDFPSKFLPKKGEFFDLKFNYIDKYISILHKEPCDVLNYSIDRKFWEICFTVVYKIKDIIQKDLYNEEMINDEFYHVKLLENIELNSIDDETKSTEDINNFAA